MRHHLVIATVFTVFAAAAGAQGLKPGLWEITNKMQMDGERGQQLAQAQAQMAAMPPEQRKMMEEMMAKQGVKLGAGGPGGMSVKICMTKEMADRNEMPVQQGDCKTTQQARSGNTMKMAFVCTNPPSSGEGQVTFMGPEAYAMKMAVTTSMQGKPERMNMEGQGKWQGSDCGNIRPMVLPKK
ncbi:DUF3617 domain-containing protein [Caenimonas sp. SL110]|uniref:DUF3617 domain-containing protein n=1 Tax=Caenimonas sp. SL110 TaxID=1450524 RepID=UPI000652F3F5|nr:DUF3617 domain-containing protein [Caenimonas sp. SL110]